MKIRIKRILAYCFIIYFFCCYFSSVAVYAEGLLSESKETMEYEAAKKWEIAESFRFQRGKFGTDDVTKIYEYDTTIERFFEKGNLALTVPFLKQRSPNSVILVEAQTLNESLGVEKSVKDGMGDVTLDATYYFLIEDDKVPLDLNLYGHVKFPTASKPRGIGTHEFDGGPGLGLSKLFFSKWRAFSDFYFTFIGNISGTYFQNEVRSDYGLEYQFNPDLSLSVSYEQSNALLKLTSDPRDIALNLNYKLNKTTRLFGNYSFGLSDGSPTQALQVGLGLSF